MRYLNAVVSNDIKSVGEAYGTRALLLNPQGHILAELEVYALAEKLLVRTHASVRERTFATLDKYIIMDDVTLEDLTDQLGSFAVEGPQAGTVVAQACGLALEGFSEFRQRRAAYRRRAVPPDSPLALWRHGRRNYRAARTSRAALAKHARESSRRARRVDRHGYAQRAASGSRHSVVSRTISTTR